MSEKKDIYRISKPFFLITKFFGLACFTVDAKTEVLRTSWFDISLFISTIILWAVSSWVQLGRKALIEDTNVESVILDTLWFFQYTIHHYLALIMVMFNFKQRKVVGKVLKTFNDFDREMENLGWVSKSQEKLFIAVVSMFFSYLVIVAAYAAAFVFENNWDGRMPTATIVFYTTNYFLVVLFFFVAAQQFILCAFCVRGRLISLHNNFRWILLCCNFKLQICLPSGISRLPTIVFA